MYLIHGSNWKEKIAEAVENNMVAALPYERLFGLAALALSNEATLKVATIKERSIWKSDKKPISVILPEIKFLQKIAKEVNPLARSLMSKFWPGPLTILVKAASSLSGPLVSDKGLVGVRLPGASPAAELAKHMGTALTATSANIPGKKDAKNQNDLLEINGIDVLLKGEVKGPPGTTVVDASGAEIKIIRQGILKIK